MSNSVRLVTETDQGNYFKIYRDGEKIWEGTKKEFVDTNLNLDYSYNYKIGIYENNKLVDIVSHKVKTKKEKLSKKALDTGYEVETELVTTVGKDYVSLEWEPIPDDDGIYEIYRDGKLLDKVSVTNYTDFTVENGKGYLYEIVASKEVSNNRKEEIKKELMNKEVDISTIDEELLYNEVKTVGKIVETIEEISENELATIDIPEEFVGEPVQTLGIPDIGSEYKAYLFRYQTFIPYASVDNPNQLHETLIGHYGTRLNGNNRGFDPFSNSYKSRVDVYADWYYPKLIDERLIGQSVLVDSDGKVLLRQTASNSGIKVHKDSVSNDKMTWRVIHDVGIPFHSSYPNINYYYEGTVYKNGNFHLRGAHDKAPNHEIYAGNAYTGARPLTAYTFTMSGPSAFFNIIPGMPQKYFEISM